MCPRPPVEKLASAGINFLAIDFDLTLVDIHTEGRWLKPASELATHVRPYMHSLIIEAFSHGMHLAIVTFSPQVDTISKVLEILFPKFSEQIVIRGGDNTWQYEGMGPRDGKQSHMASAVEELTHRTSAQISRSSTLLIDDDSLNVDVALRHGVNAVMCSPEDPETIHRGIMAAWSTTPANH
ncbi:hypothetical protein M885DRAFT_552902 [Pelagophyceae sp. CCMP2097]|nr:hypothetical protein M885DRAFT_552902 [Pelagophyceae sp. CCMP2097]